MFPLISLSVCLFHVHGLPTVCALKCPHYIVQLLSADIARSCCMPSQPLPTLPLSSTRHGYRKNWRSSSSADIVFQLRHSSQSPFHQGITLSHPSALDSKLTLRYGVSVFAQNHLWESFEYRVSSYRKEYRLGLSQSGVTELLSPFSKCNPISVSVSQRGGFSKEGRERFPSKGSNLALKGFLTQSSTSL